MPDNDPSNSSRSDLNESEFDRIMKGGKFEGQYETVVGAAHKHGISASLVASILAFETGYGKSRAVRDYNNPAGLMGGGRNNRQFMKFGTIEEGIDKAAEVQKRNYTRGGETISGMGALYAPPGAKNDPHGTNIQWPGSVARLQSRLQQYTGPEEGAGKGKRLDVVASGAELDRAAPTVNAQGRLDVDVNAPRNVSVVAEGGGVFNQTETTRQLEPMTEE